MRPLGIDLGTSGVRAVVLDEGAVVGSHGAAMPADRRRDPSSLWAAVQHVLAACDLRGVAAIAVAGTSGTLLAVSDAGAPLSQLSLYGDTAPPACADVIARLVPPGSAARGATSPLGRAIALQAVPGTRRILHEADWIAGMLCARFDTTDANNALKTGYDPLARRWPDWMAGTGMNMALLPHVITPGAALDRVTDSVSRQFGFPSDAIVAAGTTDGCASFLSTGANAPGDAVTALGSTLTLKLLSHLPVSIPDYGIYSHSLGGHWLAGGASNTGGAVLGACFTHADLDRLSARMMGVAATGNARRSIRTTTAAWTTIRCCGPGSGFRSMIPRCRPGCRPGRRTMPCSCKACWKASRGSKRWAIAV